MSRRQFNIANDLLQEDQIIDRHDSSLREQSIDVVTQEQLSELLSLRRFVNRSKELSKQIREAIKAGALVEPGMVGALVRESESKQLTAAKLRKLLGNEQAEAILNGIELTSASQLIIWEEYSQI